MHGDHTGSICLLLHKVRHKVYCGIPLNDRDRRSYERFKKVHNGIKSVEPVMHHMTLEERIQSEEGKVSLEECPLAKAYDWVNYELKRTPRL